MAATTAYLGILGRLVKGGTRIPPAARARAPAAACRGNAELRGLQMASLPAWRVRRRVPVRYPVCGTLAGIVTGRLLRDASGRTWLLSCDVPVGGSACGAAAWVGAAAGAPCAFLCEGVLSHHAEG